MASLPKKSNNHFIAILCGGSGPRLWPLSRASNPKQFLSIFGQQSVLTQTVNRALKIVKPSHIFIVTNQKYLPKIKTHLHHLIPDKNIIAEPLKKNTLMAMLYTSLIIDKIQPNPTITFLPSDHYIKSDKPFITDIKSAAKLAVTFKSIVIFGITPTSANPSYGYVQTVKTKNDHQKVTKFVEKPTIPIIKKLIKSKSVYWNSGIYTLPANTLFEQVGKYQPQYSINLINKNPKRAYQKCPRLSIDVGISQHADNILLIPANFIWSDIGEWKSIHQLLKKDKNQNSKFDKLTNFIAVNSQNCLIKTSQSKIVGLVGVKDLAIIDTPDSLLVCRLDDAFHVRDLIGQMVKSKKTIDYFLKTHDHKS